MAALSSICFWLLMRHPLVIQKLRMEIAMLDGLPPTYEQLRGLTYLRWVMDESTFSQHVNVVKPLLTYAYRPAIVPANYLLLSSG